MNKLRTAWPMTPPVSSPDPSVLSVYVLPVQGLHSFIRMFFFCFCLAFSVESLREGVRSANELQRYPNRLVRTQSRFLEPRAEMSFVCACVGGCLLGMCVYVSVTVYSVKY